MSRLREGGFEVGGLRWADESLAVWSSFVSSGRRVQLEIALDRNR